VWSSGQDQVAVIKQQLQLHMVGMRIFLDVGDLEVSQYAARLRCHAP